MARGPLTFRQRDVTRAIKAAQAAGVALTRVWIEADGKIVLGIANGQVDLVGQPSGPPLGSPEVNTWEDVA
jgi:hypothetical protein